jgi:hypothetical protein
MHCKVEYVWVWKSNLIGDYPSRPTNPTRYIPSLQRIFSGPKVNITVLAVIVLTSWPMKFMALNIAMV